MSEYVFLSLGFILKIGTHQFSCEASPIYQWLARLPKGSHPTLFALHSGVTFRWLILILIFIPCFFRSFLSGTFQSSRVFERQINISFALLFLCFSPSLQRTAFLMFFSPSAIPFRKVMIQRGPGCPEWIFLIYAVIICLSFFLRFPLFTFRTKMRGFSGGPRATRGRPEPPPPRWKKGEMKTMVPKQVIP